MKSSKESRRDGDGTAVFECSKREITIRRTSSWSRIFSQTLPKVRCALANIPSYMIFDDHEVTDDWNMTRNFCRDFYGKALGQRVARNALTAYALCQHWGNVPDQFADTAPAPPGLDLLRRLDTPNPHLPKAFDQKAASLEQHSETITSLLGLHDEAALQ